MVAKLNELVVIGHKICRAFFGMERSTMEQITFIFRWSLGKFFSKMFDVEETIRFLTTTKGIKHILQQAALAERFVKKSKKLLFKFPTLTT